MDRRVGSRWLVAASAGTAIGALFVGVVFGPGCGGAKTADVGTGGPEVVDAAASAADAGVTPIADAGADCDLASHPGNDAGAPDMAPPPPVAFSEADWPQYRHDIHSTWRLGATLSTANALHLGEKWHRDLGPYGYTEPVIAGDTVYEAMGFSGIVFALDVTDGHTRWSKNLNHIFHPMCAKDPIPTGFYASPALAGGVLYVASPDGNLYALDPATGATLWSVKIASPEEEFVQSSPAVSVALGKLFLGVGSVADCAPVVGRVLSVDLATHAIATRDLPPMGRRGAPVWSSITVDEPAGRIYVTSGDPATNTTVQVPLSNSFLALDAGTLAVLDHWQDPTSENDSDFGASPTLFAADDGTALLAAPNKDGTFWVMKRSALAAGPLWSYPLALGGDPTDPTGGRGSLVAPTIDHGLLYVAGGRTPMGAPGQVVAFAPSTHASAPKWIHPSPGYVMAGMPSVGEVLVVASTAVGNGSGTVEILDAKTGAALRSFHDASAIFAAPAAGRGVIVWIDFAGRLTALSVMP